jgi:hypothetical protein
LPGAGPFAVAKLPPGAHYEVVLLVASETADGMESYTLIDSVLNVPAGTTGIHLRYDGADSEVYGNVIDTDGQALLGATVLLSHPATGRVAGFARVDHDGRFAISCIKPGTYMATAVHSGYVNTSKSIQVFSGLSSNIGTIGMPPAGASSGK